VPRRLSVSIHDGSITPFFDKIYILTAFQR
jgi:hypothetical protein